MLKDFIIPFIAIGIAELGDKTQFAIFCLSGKTKKYLSLFLGILLAFILADGLAVILGNLISGIVPGVYIRILSGILFIAFGVFALINAEKDEEKLELKTPFLSAFTIIFVSELGDKTQVASGLFAASYSPVWVFFGVIAALTALSIIAISLGRYIFSRLNPRIISTVSGILFISIGIFSLFR
ncbi:MAG TPA: TMEM165/GDT1 family protein [Candidatus Nanoarchaeia archaeon]|nr:TMEM165/GDT1 family protein [Candidatus Nanoarchaeia archaeon]